METFSNKNLQKYRTDEIEQVIRDLQKELSRRNEQSDFTGQYVYDVREQSIDDEVEQIYRTTVDMMLCVGNNECDDDYLVCNIITVYKETNENTGETTISVELYNGVHVKKREFARYRQLDGDIFQKLIKIADTQYVKVDRVYQNYRKQDRAIRNCYGAQAVKIIGEKLGLDI
jgi:hypothetical protein